MVSSNMAASRVASASRRLCLRYQLFFFVVFFLLVIQLYLAFSFWTYSQQEMDKLEAWKKRVERLEEEHKNEIQIQKPYTDEPKLNGNGVGAADRVNVIGHPQLPRKSDHHRLSKHNRDEHDKNNVSKINGVLQKHEMLLYDGSKVGKDVEREEPRCKIKSKDANAAIMRASSNRCKNEIAQTACLSQEDKLYPKSLPRSCPLKDNTYMQYMGCFHDDRRDRQLNGHNTEFREENSPYQCVNHCLRAGFKYAGVQFSYECWCGDSVSVSHKVAEERCDSKCSGNSSQVCGGYLIISVYHTGFGERPSNNAMYVRGDSIPNGKRKARIAYVLTVNGRGLRQVHRLFKSIYHINHYYYIHVDARQEYLHRELSKLTKRFSNVRISSWHLSTIWGGASLLRMHLHCMADLLAMKDWYWDYFINLSESDYPIKPLEDLTAFLTKYKGKNFLRSHGRDTPKFIQKQGLDKTFHECDNHMWRLGSRRLPDGLRVDGGSDWLGLHRDLCEYILTTQDELILGLLKYYKHTLLPSESFFHSVVINSKFCTSHVNNNLHLTNWVRNRGCKCQYKHIVDWCGCSPMDYVTADITKLLAHENRPMYFARKFESIVNQEVINELDTYLYGNYPEDTPGLLSYWQSEYHAEDTETTLDDAYMTFYHTFSQLGTQQVRAHQGEASSSCSFIPTKILEASVYSNQDQIQGLLIRYAAQSFVDKKEYELETFVQPQKKYKVLQPVGPVSRLKFLEVGTKFDLKEEIFRNYGGLFGPYSELVLSHSWGVGQQFTATVVWVDPTNQVAASYDVPIKANVNIAVQTPSFQKPLRPGIWTVKLLYLWEVAAEVQFLVTPLSYYGGRPITDDEAAILHAGPPKGMYTERDFHDISKQLQLDEESLILEKIAQENAAKKGQTRQDWIEELTRQMWLVSDSCIRDRVHAACPRLPACQKTSWSSLSPDPKSEIGPVNPESGRIR